MKNDQTSGGLLADPLDITHDLVKVSRLLLQDSLEKVVDDLHLGIAVILVQDGGIILGFETTKNEHRSISTIIDDQSRAKITRPS